MSSQTGQTSELDTDFVMREMAKVRQRVTALEEENEELHERIDHLHDTITQLVTDLPTSKKTKREKMAAIIRYAVKNGVTTPRGVNISKEAAAGAASCSPRHVLNLFDDLDEQFEWAHKITEPTASLGIDFGDRDADTFLQDVSQAFPEVSRE